jgi:hypothetical protein
MANNNLIKVHTFHNNTNSVGNGTQYNVHELASVVKLQFICSGTFTAVVEAQLVDTNTWYPYDAYTIPTYDLITTNITDKNYLYEVDVTGISALRIRLTSLTGTLTCYGRIVG